MIEQPQQTKIQFQLPQDLLKNQITAHKFIKKAHDNSIQTISPHPSFQSYASGSHDKTIKIWDLHKVTSSQTLTGHTQGVWSLDYSNDGKYLISGSPDKSIIIWNNNNKSTNNTKLLGHKDKIYCVKTSNDSKFIASVGQGGQLFIWDIAKSQAPIKKLQTKYNVCYDIAWSENSDYLFMTALGGTTLAIDTKTLTIVDQKSVSVEPHIKMQGICLNWKTLPKKIFCGCESGNIIWYNYQDNKLIKQIQFFAHTGQGCRNVNLHPSKQYMLSSGKDGSVRLWNCQKQGKPQIIANLVFHQDNVTSPIFVGNQIIITGSWDQNIGIWKFKDLIEKL